jgi:CHC2 zinc finger
LRVVVFSTFDEELAMAERNGTQPAGFVDLNRAKQVPFVDALHELGLLEKLRREGDELNGICPLHGGEKESFGVHVVRGVFNCFACKKKGNVLDFVMSYKKVSVREAGQWLIDLLDRSLAEIVDQIADRGETPAGEEQGADMQAMCRALARYLSAAFPMLGDANKVAGELGVLLAEETGTLPVSEE